MKVSRILNNIQEIYKDDKKAQELNKFLDEVNNEYINKNICTYDKDGQMLFLVRYIKKYKSKKISGCAFSSKIVTDVIQDDVQLLIFKLYLFGYKDKILELEQSNQNLIDENYYLKEKIEQNAISFDDL